MIHINNQHGIKLNMAARHGFITGSTGSGKSTTLAVLAKEAYEHGIPSLVVDVKGDISGLARHVDEVEMWDTSGKNGRVFRAPVNSFDPVTFGKLLNLNETQTAALAVLYKAAPDIYTLEELRDVVYYVHQDPSRVNEFGLVSKSTMGVIMRNMVYLEDGFFYRSGFHPTHWIRNQSLNILNVEELIKNPQMYAAVMIWIIDSLYEALPEVGAPDKPVFMLFIDEAHLLFRGTPKALIERIEMRIKLIRSKGVGVYFITQTPSDIPDAVLGQLGNKIQHALYAYTPKEMRSVRAAADAFRSNPDLDVRKSISELGVGEAIISTLDSRGIPTVAQKVQVDYLSLEPYRYEPPVEIAVKEEPLTWLEKLKKGLLF